MPVSTALGKWRQEDPEFKANLGLPETLPPWPPSKKKTPKQTNGGGEYYRLIL